MRSREPAYTPFHHITHTVSFLSVHIFIVNVTYAAVRDHRGEAGACMAVDFLQKIASWLIFVFDGDTLSHFLTYCLAHERGSSISQ